MNYRQRIFDILSRQDLVSGQPLTPPQIVTMSAAQKFGERSLGAMGIDTVTAALKWLVANGIAQKHRHRRDFGYTLVEGAQMPVDGRTIAGRRNGTT